MRKQKVQSIKSEAEYETALDEIEAYFDNEPRPGTPDADRFNLLAQLIHEYEELHWPVAS